MGYKLKTHSGQPKDLKELDHQNQGVQIETIFLLNNLQKEKDIIEVLIS